jgi:hypothetical protein
MGHVKTEKQKKKQNDHSPEVMNTHIQTKKVPPSGVIM